MGILLSALPFGFILWWAGLAIRGLVRKIRRPKIVQRIKAESIPQDVSQALTAISAGNYQQFKSSIQSMPTTSLAGFYTNREEFENPIARAYVERLELEHPNEPNTHLLVASLALCRAISILTGRHDSSLSQPEYQEYCNYLGEAEKSLQKTIAIDPSIMDAYALLILVYMRGRKRRPAKAAFTEAKLIDQNHFDIHRNMLLLLSGRGLGSSDEAMAFAREMAATDPRGQLNTLIALAHCDHWMRLPESAAKLYFDSKTVRKELTGAAKPLLKWRPLTRKEKDPRQLVALNYLAFCLVHARRNRLARRAFKRIGYQYREQPWTQLYKQPIDVFLTFKWSVNG